MTTVTGNKCTAFTNTTSTPFLTNLSLGITHPDVLRLQQYLNTHGALIASIGAGSPGKETSHFGALTKAALIRFQEMNKAQILTPSGLSKGTGYFGPATRNFINK